MKSGLTEGLVGGAIKAAVSRALNWPDPTRLFVITFEIERPRELTLPDLSVKSAIAIDKGSTWPEFMSISKSFALDMLIKRKTCKGILTTDRLGGYFLSRIERQDGYLVI